ncbi:MAG TPA: DUF362 domain-containing protein [Phycisphaerales bacterium]|nr:DUF362 domain-containing protein [Phycisphaerales bacterium]
MNVASSGISRPTVLLQHVPGYDGAAVRSAVREQLDRCDPDGRRLGRGLRVLIKPNFIMPRPRHQAVQTDPAVILAVAEALKDRGARPFVGDSPGWGRLDQCVRVLDLDGPLARLGVPVTPLNQPVLREIPGCDGFRMRLSRVALDADAVVNLPKFKAHQQLVATFAVKNMFGCVPGKRKAWWHFARGRSHDDFCAMLLGVCRLLAPVVTIVDGIVAMEGTGPIRGRPRALGVLCGGPNPIACEHVCCAIAGFDPRTLPILQTARRQGIGPRSLDEIKIVGKSLEDVFCRDFEPAEQRPLRFSLPRVGRSIMRQVFLLLRADRSTDDKDPSDERESRVQ